MKPHKAKTAAEALKLQALMHKHGAWCEIGLDHKTLTWANDKAWKRVWSQWEDMKVIRKAAESRSMMETKELL